MTGGRTQVVAHRGSSASHAEHTLAAYELAIDEGADALECDVRLTRDGVLVCVHDRKVDRTSDGRGVVSTLELAELAELDFASWKKAGGDPLLEASWEEPDLDRGRVLTLERLLQLVEGTRVELHIETKHPTRYGGLVERALVDLLERYGVARPLTRSVSPVTVMSFAPTSLRRVHAMAPQVPTVYLMDRVPVRYRDGSLPSQVYAAGPSIEVVRAHPSYVSRVQARGHRVHVWTCDEPTDIDLVVELGVDAVISNHPRRALRRLGRL
ncbi:MAG: glycerophosphodiester phosphodiesterase family protein [Mycobacteriales bacterium]|nr:glycerophosphodiester phosphodiesterase family protein [Mycobacteriales bacterium]